MRRLAIVNSECLGRLRKREASSLIEALKKRLGAEVRMSEYPGAVSDIVKDASGFDTIISAGGDGTTFEIVNGVEIGRQTFGILPIGTGNSLSHDLGISSVEGALEAIEREETRDVDLVEVRFKNNDTQDRRYMVVTAGIGFFADVAKSANAMFKRIGKRCYAAAAFYHSIKRERMMAEVSLNGHSPCGMEFTDLLINNTTHIAYMPVCREASFSDGNFNVWVSKMGAIGQLMWNIGILTKTYFYYPGSKHCLNRMKIAMHKPCNLMLDGEFLGQITEAEFLISKHKLPVLC
ncbi:MAG: hypothetical protein HQ558_00010 [Candidatus Omnitrophica bacterium]|nr:hypothetical protein [Candidatus Omnitrophota bacterium]